LSVRRNETEDRYHWDDEETRATTQSPISQGFPPSAVSKNQRGVDLDGGNGLLLRLHSSDHTVFYLRPRAYAKLLSDF